MLTLLLLCRELIFVHTPLNVFTYLPLSSKCVKQPDGSSLIIFLNNSDLKPVFCLLKYVTNVSRGL